MLLIYQKQKCIVVHQSFDMFRTFSPISLYVILNFSEYVIYYAHIFVINHDLETHFWAHYRSSSLFGLKFPTTILLYIIINCLMLSYKCCTFQTINFSFIHIQKCNGLWNQLRQSLGLKVQNQPLLCVHK